MVVVISIRPLFVTTTMVAPTITVTLPLAPAITPIAAAHIWTTLARLVIVIPLLQSPPSATRNPLFATCQTIAPLLSAFSTVPLTILDA